MSKETYTMQHSGQKIDEAVDSVLGKYSITEYDQSNLTDGGFYYAATGGTISISSSGSWSRIEIDVKVGDEVVVNSYGGNAAVQWVLGDSTKKKYDASAANVTTESVLTDKIKNNGYLYVNCNASYKSVFSVVRKRKIEDDIDTRLESKINSSIKKTETYTDDDLYEGGYYGLATSKASFVINEGNNWYCMCVPVNRGDVVTLSTTGGNNGRAYGVTDKKLAIKEVADASVTIKDKVISITEDGYLFVNKLYSYNFFALKIVKDRLTIIEDYDKIITKICGDIDVYDHMPKSNDDPCYSLKNTIGFASSIKEWGVIGASYESGEFEYLNGSTVVYEDFYKYSWPQVFAAINNIDVYNFSYGGCTSKSWLTADKTQKSQAYIEEHGDGGGGWLYAKNNPKKAYIISLGNNDIARVKSEEYPVGDLSTDIGIYDPTTDTDTNARSVAGYYASIIQRLRSIQPKCIIFVASVRNARATTDSGYSISLSINEVIKHIPDYFDSVIFVDVFSKGMNWLESEFKSKYTCGGHPNAMGHYVQGLMYNSLIENAIRSNQSMFLQSQWIGYDRSR